jgi:hypothetical protein
MLRMTESMNRYGFKVPVALVNARNKFEAVCKQENDLDFLKGKSSLPKNAKVFHAFQNYLKVLNEPTLKNVIEQFPSLRADLHNHFGPRFLHDHKINPLNTLNQLNNENPMNCSSAEKNLALYFAVKMGSLTVTKSLLEQGADIHFMDKNGISVLEMMQKNTLMHHFSKEIKSAAVTPQKISPEIAAKNASPPELLPRKANQFKARYQNLKNAETSSQPVDVVKHLNTPS